MAGTVLKIEGPEVAQGGSGGTVINLTLHQESGMAYLCKGAASLLARRAAAKDAAGAAPARRPRGGEQAVLGGAQILLGALCIGLGVILSFAPTNLDSDSSYYYYYYYNRAINNGVPFWMGSLFILSGTFSVVGARRGGKWVHLATFLNLASVVAGSVAFTVGLTEFVSPAYQPSFVEQLCKHKVSEDRGYRYWQATTSPPYDDQRDQGRFRKCQEVVWALARMWSLTQIQLLILHSVALCIAILSFGYGLLRLCCSCGMACQDYMPVKEADALPVSEELGKEQNPA